MTSTSPNLNDALHIEGARSYLDASNALLFYQKEVQRKCCEVMEGYLADYSSALGITLNADEIAGMAWPESVDRDGSYASLGAVIQRKQVLSGIRWWETSCCLTWETTFYCWIGEWFPTRKMAADVYERFHKLDSTVMVYEKELGVYEVLTPEQAPTFDEALARLSQRWIKLWKMVGGMKKALKT